MADYESDNISVGSLALFDDISVAGGGVDDNHDSPEVIARKKSRQLRCTKIFFLSMLLSSAIVLIIGAIVTLKPDEGTIDDPQEMEEDNSGLYAGIVAGIFAFLLLVFLRYDYLVSRRNSFVLHMATRSRSIVDQLFPADVRDRLLREGTSVRGGSSHNDRTSNHGDDPFPLFDSKKLTEMNTKANIKIAETAPLPLGNPTTSDGRDTGPPIADLYPNCTVMFADIAGFTAWSSERDPPQVFILLETIYAAFDEIGERLKVFKVETIGDCYLAVTGLPQPDEKHAISMARFAYQCLIKMQTITKELEAVLGPGTNELQLRVGLHSGPVTAGVLRGQKSRFQLFGDTVNTASRMESTGQRGSIQVSKETAILLVDAGKQHWIRERGDKIIAKGKGELTTYWLDPSHRTQSYQGSSEASPHDSTGDLDVSRRSIRSAPSIDMRTVSTEYRDLVDKLVDWNTETLMKYLISVSVCRNKHVKSKSTKPVDHVSETSEFPPPIESVSEVIILPTFDPAPSNPEILSEAKIQNLRRDMRSYVKEISNRYDEVAFHNFEHASHVTMAMDKLLTRLSKSKRLSAFDLHMRTYGISSDPLTQFTMVLACLVHDTGHLGVPNSVLVAEKHELATLHQNISVAEQHSVTLAWKILMKPQYINLRRVIYTTNVERKRFRQVLVNAVMATDISDRTLIRERALKWEKAFGVEREGVRLSKEELNRGATALLEHLIQVADVAHTMQHWQIYRKWNEKLFAEMVTAFRNGRAAFDPVEHWSRGEIGFFDNYVIPLARKIKDSGIFGSSGDMYLSCALSIRNEWEKKGESEVEKMKVMLNIPQRSDIVGEMEESDDDSIMEGYAEASSHTSSMLPAPEQALPPPTKDPMFFF